MQANKEQTGQIADDINVLSRYFAEDDFGGEALTSNHLRSVGVIVLLGNQVVATLTHACTVAQIAPHAVLLFSGGVGHATKSLYENLCSTEYIKAQRDFSATTPEADIYASLAQSAFDIPAHRIVVENRSTNCGENSRFSIRALKDAGLERKTVLLLQDPTIQRRSMLTWQREAEAAGVGARPHSHPTFVPRVESALDGAICIHSAHAKASWTLARLVGMLMGEIQRLRDDETGYGPRGRNYFDHVDIPAEVLDSYARLAGSDFVRQLESSSEFRR
jgi:uncharacterized SAM-binding protein YcdF (DUF218 family)